jgi:hypothetical protein
MSGPIYCRVWIFAALIATLAGSFVFFFATSPAFADPLNAPADPLRSRAQGVSSSVAAPPDASSPVRSAPSVSSPLPRSEPQQLQSPERSASTSAGCLPAPLKQALADVQSRFGAVEVVSTHRPGARISGTGHRSLHASCQAVDFRPARGTYGAVASYLRTNWQGGVGTYSSGHIHIDTGANYQWHQGAARASVRSAERR